MPLLERQPVDLIPLPELPGTHHGEVWQIRFTGEIFLSYEDYYARYNFLRKRHFTCSKTGRTDLSYEDALASEREATRRMEENFPEPWRRPALQLIHYSLDRLNPLVERLYEYFKDRIFIDEYVYIAVEGTFALAKVLEIVPVESGTGADSVEVLYRVNLVDPENELLTSQDVDGDLPVEYLLPAQELKRDRTELSKQRFRKFVRDVANKEPWIGAPWVVRPDLLKRYQIHDIIPPLVADLLEERHRKLVGDVVRDKDVDGQEPTNYHKNSKKKGLKIKEDAAAPAQAKIRVNVKFPIDDLDVLEIATYSKKQLQFKRPPLQREFGKFPISHCTMLLEVWMFICIYNKPLDLQLISLDDFIEVLEFDTSHERLMPEVFGTFLNIACKDWGGSVETGNMFAKSSDTQDLEGRRFSPYDADTQLEMHHYLQIYQELTSDEQASIDQWWKWEPGRWAQQSHSAQKSTSSAANSLKAWEIVLAGVLRDWIPASRYPRKWGTLCQLLKGVLGESRQSSPSKDREDNQNDVDVDIEGDTSLAGSPAPFVAEESIEHEWSSLDVDTGASRRSGLRKRTRKEQDEEHNSDQSVPTGSRISTRNKRKVAKFIPESAPAAKITPTTSPSSRAKSRKKKEEKKLAFDRLCQSAAAGFESLTAVERLELLAIIMEVCVGPSSIVRQYIEDCKEKSLELKKDKREMARERKELNAARADFDGREREASPSHSVDSPATDANSVTSTVRIDGESGSSDGESGSESDDGNSSRRPARTTTRVQKLKEEQARRLVEERRRLEEAAQERQDSKARQKEHRLRAEERKRLDEQERSLSSREASVDHQLRISTAVARVRPLGRDRFHNRYWWFDMSLGVGSDPHRSTNAAKSGLRTRGQSHRESPDWISGRLFVEEVGLEPLTRLTEVEQDVVKQGLTEGVWGYYDDPHQIETLLQWLDPRGVREMSLKTTLEQLADEIGAAMISRQEDRGDPTEDS